MNLYQRLKISNLCRESDKTALSHRYQCCYLSCNGKESCRIYHTSIMARVWRPGVGDRAACKAPRKHGMRRWKPEGSATIAPSVGGRPRTENVMVARPGKISSPGLPVAIWQESRDGKSKIHIFLFKFHSMPCNSTLHLIARASQTQDATLLHADEHAYIHKCTKH